MTIAELTVCGKAAILIPLPTAIYNHQLRMPRSWPRRRRSAPAASGIDRAWTGANRHTDFEGAASASDHE